MNKRNTNVACLDNTLFDVVIVGGGINGASLFDLLSRRKCRVLLIDKGDFASGTSQASAMMIWGGLLYMRNLDFRSVINFSKSRDAMVQDMQEWVSPRSIKYLPNKRGLQRKIPVLSAMYLYWLLGRFQRKRPQVNHCYPEQTHLHRQCDCLVFEEAMLRTSDSRFVMNLLTQSNIPQHVAVNYCQLTGGEYHHGERLWHLNIRDLHQEQEKEISARVVVNCGGVWTDTINQLFNIQAPYKHVFSKGVLLGMPPLPKQSMPLVFAEHEHNDVILSVPWGPITLWGPTETAINDLQQGFSVSQEDVEYLLGRWEQHIQRKPTRKDIVSFRCGVRPLAVKTDYAKKRYPLDLSRRFRSSVAQDYPWISVYGGKITGCDYAAGDVAKKIESLGVALPIQTDQGNQQQGPLPHCPITSFPGIVQPVPTLEWCIQNESCCTLEDYLRRRTNIAQWVPREGLGHDNEHEEHLRELCRILYQGDRQKADQHLTSYSERVKQRFDLLLDQI